MAKINDTTTFPNTAPALTDHVIGTDVSDTALNADGKTVTFLLSDILALAGGGRTWQDVSGSRTAGTSYQNTTGGEIEVAVLIGGSPSATLEVSDDNSTWLTLFDGDSDAALPCTATIPDNWYYRVANSFARWHELRP
jgi:hypothetical protein